MLAFSLVCLALTCRTGWKQMKKLYCSFACFCCYLSFRKLQFECSGCSPLTNNPFANWSSFTLEPEKVTQKWTRKVNWQTKQLFLFYLTVELQILFDKNTHVSFYKMHSHREFKQSVLTAKLTTGNWWSRLHFCAGMRTVAYRRSYKCRNEHSNIVYNLDSTA